MATLSCILKHFHKVADNVHPYVGIMLLELESIRMSAIEINMRQIDYVITLYMIRRQ